MVLCQEEDTMRTSISNRFFTPMLTPFLESRTLALTIVGCAVTQTLLVFFGLPSWQCPIRAATGVPCPGCGLSSAMVLLLKGRWLESLERHAFAPIFLLAFVVLGVASVLPTAWHQKHAGHAHPDRFDCGEYHFQCLGWRILWQLTVRA